MVLRVRQETWLALFNGFPSELLNLKIGHPIENAITTHDYEILVLVHILTA